MRLDEIFDVAKRHAGQVNAFALVGSFIVEHKPDYRGFLSLHYNGLVNLHHPESQLDFAHIDKQIDRASNRWTPFTRRFYKRYDLRKIPVDDRTMFLKRLIDEHMIKPAAARDMQYSERGPIDTFIITADHRKDLLTYAVLATAFDPNVFSKVRQPGQIPYGLAELVVFNKLRHSQ